MSTLYPKLPADFFAAVQRALSHFSMHTVTRKGENGVVSNVAMKRHGRSILYNYLLESKSINNEITLWPFAEKVDKPFARKTNRQQEMVRV